MFSEVTVNRVKTPSTKATNLKLRAPCFIFYFLLKTLEELRAVTTADDSQQLLERARLRIGARTHTKTRDPNNICASHNPKQCVYKLFVYKELCVDGAHIIPKCGYVCTRNMWFGIRSFQ